MSNTVPPAMPPLPPIPPLPPQQSSGQLWSALSDSTLTSSLLAPNPPAHLAGPPAPSIGSPADSWRRIREGNKRFIAGNPAHPSQGISRRHAIAGEQHPHTIIFGCSDSRVAAEIIFDQGLGDMFVVRTAGHVVDVSVLATIEYGAVVLGAPLIVVLGHDSCGAVKVAAEVLSSRQPPPEFLRPLVDGILPSISAPGTPGQLHRVDPHLGSTLHVRHTVETLAAWSAPLRGQLDTGRLAIVGLEYSLAEGAAQPVHVIGDIGDPGFHKRG
jgi:carbonic anhydrase